MKLYCTPGSPYARMARMMVIEKGLESRIEIIFAQTRREGSPYYEINPSGRVPYLVREDGVGMEESRVICDYLDRLDVKRILDAEGWESRRLESLARSLMDGVAVWLRELYRPQHERSPGVIRHEIARAARLVDLWEREIGHPHMHRPFNLAQLTLACALGIEARLPDWDWRSGHPKLVEWHARLAARPSFAATAPPKPA